MIEIRDLTVQVPGFRLQSIGLEAGASDIFALIGPTGSGKSLLLEAVAGLVPVQGGRVRIQGKDVTDLPPEKRRLGLVYQDQSLFPHLSVRDNIHYGVRYHRLDAATRRDRFEHLVRRLDLGHILERSTIRLSGGEKQRVALARALMLQPGALLLDEPLSALDPVFRDDIRVLLHSLHQELAIPFVLVSHNFSEVLFLAGRGAVLRDGVLEQSGPIRDLFERPATPFCARFVGMKNLVPCTVEQGRARLGDVTVRLPGADVREGRGTLGLRPEDIVLVEDGDRSCDHVLRARISALEGQGFYFRVSLSLEPGGLSLSAFWTRQVVDRHRLQPNDLVRIGFSSRCLHAIYD